MSWRQKIEGWVKKSSPDVPIPQTLQNYLDPLTGPNEQHSVEDPGVMACENPKCRAPFSEQDLQGSEAYCKNCGHVTDLYGQPQGQIFAPGGQTRSGLTPTEMGDIGENIILRLGELPGIGSVSPASNSAIFPIDAIVSSPRGNFGCEIKSTHSQATPIFKLGDKEERHAKMRYCLENGLKPALIGVRLNFYTDKAYVFFREGLIDTAISNDKMKHVGTFDFADLNPFKSPDPQAQAMAIERANLPDQSEDEFSGVFDKTSFDEEQHPRDDSGQFRIKQDVHELPVHDKKGKPLHVIKRCQHCGVPYGHPGKGRVECPSCGEDPERKLNLAKIILAEANDVAKAMGFTFLGTNSQGHRQYSWQDEMKINHVVGTGSGAHGKRAGDIDAQRVRQRMNKCVAGKCGHVPLPSEINPIDEPNAPLLKVGQTVQTNGGQFGMVTNIDGELTTIQNFETGQREYAQTDQLQAMAASGDPDYIYVYYMSELHIEEWEHGRRYEDLFDELLEKFGVDMGNSLMDIDPTKMDGGEVYITGSDIKDIAHKQLSDPTVRQWAELAIKDWWKELGNDADDWKSESEWLSL